jgi:DNA (cytosine-5)-methyltransferase 1
VVPIAIGTAHTQSNGSGFSDGVAHTLESGPSQAVAFNLRGRDGGALPELSDAVSLRAASGGSSNSYVAFSAKDSGVDVSEIAPTLRSMNNRSGNPNGGGQVAIAFTLPGSDGTVSTATPTDVAGSVRTKAPGSIENSSTTLAQQGMAVRRLIPRECERLQGFPDDYTLIEYRDKLAADGPRYRALGNSMAVPVMRWIGQRIATVDAILHETGVRRQP